MKPTPLKLFELALEQSERAVHWRLAFGLIPYSAPSSVRNRALGLAVAAEDEAFATINRLRIALGGEPIHDPADPPPVRPDD